MEQSDQSIASFADVHREVFFWRHRLAAVLDAAENDLCHLLPASTREPEIQAEIAVVLDAFAACRNSDAAWQDIYSDDAELVRHALALLQNIPSIVLPAVGALQPRSGQRPFFSLCRR
jgi:hypothetical protein